MSEIKWYKRDPNASLVGMMCLTLEERGAYNTVLDLIYDNGGKVIDDDRFLAGWMRCDVRVWKRIKNRLLELGKLYNDGDFLRSYAADRGVSDALLRIGSAKEAGRASAAKREAQLKENNDIASTPVERPFQQTTTTTITRDSVTNVTAEDDLFSTHVDFKKVLFTEGLKMLGGDKARSLLGKWIRDYGEPSVVAAMLEAQKQSAVEPKSYMLGILKKGNTHGQQSAFNTNRSTVTEYKSRSERAKDALRSAFPELCESYTPPDA